jgi:hypothetical protein
MEVYNRLFRRALLGRKRLEFLHLQVAAAARAFGFAWNDFFERSSVRRAPAIEAAIKNVSVYELLLLPADEKAILGKFSIDICKDLIHIRSANEMLGFILAVRAAEAEYFQ